MAADNQILIEIDLDDTKIVKSYDNVTIKAKKAGKDIEKNFNDSLNKINAKNVDALNDSLEDLNKNLKKNTKQQSETVKSSNGLLRIFSDLSNVLDFAVDNIDLLIFALVSVGTVSDKAGFNFAKLIDSFGDLKDNAGEESIKKFAGALTGVFGDLGILDDALIAFGPQIISFARKFGLADDIIGAAGEKIEQFGLQIGALVAGIAAFGKSGKNLRNSVKDIGKVFFSNTKNVFGITSAFTGLALVSAGLGKALEDVENKYISFIQKTAVISAVVFGGLAAAITFTIVKIGQFINVIGKKLVNVFINISQAYIDASTSLVVFSRTVETFNRITEKAIFTTATWERTVIGLSDVFNQSVTSLRRAGAEIISVGSKLGLTADQQRKLLGVTAEYAKITGKDVFDASVAFVSALNGQSQSVLSYGVKMNEASLQQNMLREGMSGTFRSLAEGTKVQSRFNFLLKQWSQISGLGVAAAGTMGDQQQRLATLTERVNIQLGKGAALVEQNNITALLFSSILATVNSTAIATIGFLGALGARFLQFSGWLLQVSFAILGVVKGIKLINILLKSSLLQTAFGRSIPLIGLSLNQMVSTMTGGKQSIKSFTDILKVFGIVVKKEFAKIPKLLSTISASFLSLTAAALPWIAIGLAIALIGKLLFEAFKKIEEQTGVFSEVWAFLVERFNSSKGIFTFISKLFKDFGGAVLTAFNKAIGVAAVGIGFFIQKIAQLVASNPFGKFSEETVQKFSDIERKLAGFNKQLIAADFDIAKLGNTALASVDKMNNAFREVKLEELQALRDVLEDVGKTDSQKLGEELADRLDLITRAFEQELVTQKEYNFLKLQAEKDFRDKLKAATKANQSELGKATVQAAKSLNRIVVQGIATLGAALVRGSDAFKDFGKFVLGIVGDMMINIGTAILGIGHSINAVAASLKTFFGGFAIVAGIALIAFGGLLKSLGTGGIGVAGGGTSIGSGGGPDDGGVIVGSEDEDIEEKTTKVAINVEGTVLDPVAVGNQIAEILNDTFDAGGTKVVTA